MNEQEVKSLIKEHLERRPLMRARDVYKLLYQGVFGIGHIMGDRAGEWLEFEAKNINLDDHLGDPLLERVSFDSLMVRVNLRPYLRMRLSLSKLFLAMKKSAKKIENEKSFLKAWDVFREMVYSQVFQIDKEEFEELDSEIRREGCKPHHHSKIYRNAYHPAYRVVRRDVFEDIFGQKLTSSLT